MCATTALMMWFFFSHLQTDSLSPILLGQWERWCLLMGSSTPALGQLSTRVTYPIQASASPVCLYIFESKAQHISVFYSDRVLVLPQLDIPSLLKCSSSFFRQTPPTGAQTAGFSDPDPLPGAHQYPQTLFCLHPPSSVMLFPT